MAISVTTFQRRCLEIVRRVEQTGEPVVITRRGKVVARLCASSASGPAESGKPWEQLRALGARLLAAPAESVFPD